MSSSVTRGVIANGLANLFQKGVRILDQLLLVPFFLSAWGAAFYGEWLTLSIIPSILAFSDLGFGSAVSNSFVLAYAAGDKQRAADLNKSGYLVISFSVLLGALATLVLLVAGYRSGLFSKTLIPAWDAMVAVTLMMTSRIVGFYTQLAEAYYRSARQAARGSFLSSCQSVLNILVGLCVLMSGAGVVGYAASQFMVSIVFTVIFCLIGRRLISFDGSSGRILRSDMHTICSKGVGYLMTPVWQSIYFQGSTFVVRLVLGAEAVAVFNTVRTVCRSVNQVFSIINAAIFPDLQFEYGRGNITLVHRLFRISVLFSMVLGLLGVVALCLFGPYLYAWWTKGLLAVPADVWNVFMLGALFNAIWWTSVVTYRMTNQPYHFAVMSTLMSAVSVLLSYFLAGRWGLIGAAVGSSLFEFVMMLYILPDSCQMLGIRVSDLFIHVKEDWAFLKQKVSYV